MADDDCMDALVAVTEDAPARSARLRATATYYRVWLRRAVVATFTHANKQGVVLGAVISIVASWVYTQREKNVALGPLVWATVIAAALVLGAWFVIQLLAMPFRMHSELEERVKRLEGLVGRPDAYRANLEPTFDYDDEVGLVVRVNNRGPTLWVRLNLIVPAPYGVSLERILEDETVAPGSRHQINGRYRWSEHHVELPGANTTYGFRFRIEKLTAPIEVVLGLNTDEFGDWIDWHATVLPRALDTEGHQLPQGA